MIVDHTRLAADFARLSEPFPPNLVSWRVGSMNKDKTKGMALAYIDARDVMRRLDDVCGPAGWQARYPHANGKTICEIGIKVADEWIWKANGAGDTDIEAEKGAISDAFKRAAVMWGIGRYLYDLPSPWVAINQFKQIEGSEYKRLEALLKGEAARVAVKSDPTSPAPAKPPQANIGAGEVEFADELIARLKDAPTLFELGRIWKGAWAMIEGHARQAEMTKAKDDRKALLTEREQVMA